ncbi:TrkA family potassium uptake protein [Rhodococcus sp. BUPNP1]|uniref:potassium channel family protein n=1 Tax=Rhodococcus TaxID=1827 RepID=UPI000B5AAD42|nr:potassium channel family protein [Rhodococcus sp. BUPNP1]OWY81545.1 potassium transporter Kef [Rhodococcus sp. BUPNP1]
MTGPGRRAARPDALTDRPSFALTGIVRVPQRQASPGRAIVRRIGSALAALAAVVVVVYLDRDGYTDVRGDGLSLFDCLYYATVSLSTTGYGDIAPVTDTARLVNVVLITPLRIFFLIVLVGTTLSVLTETSRQARRIRRWRRRARHHTIMIGYGTTGRAAIDAMLAEGRDPAQIVVVDSDPAAQAAAAGRGLVTIAGSAIKADVLRLAGAGRATAVVVAVDRDDTAVLVTLSIREIAPTVPVTVAIRESANVRAARRAGADSVVLSSETAGRMLGLAVATPTGAELVDELLTSETGPALTERQVRAEEIGCAPHGLPDPVVAVVRNGQLLRAGASEAGVLEAGDRLVQVRRLVG